MPDFSAFAYDPAVGMRVPPSPSENNKEEAVQGDSSAASRVTRSGSKRTRTSTGKLTNASAVKRSVNEEEEVVAVSSTSKRFKKESTPPMSKSTIKPKSGPNNSSSPAVKSTPNAKAPKKSPGGSGRKRTPKIEPGSLPPPKNWEDIWDLVYELRQDRSAPVDTDGGHALPQHDRGERVYRFQVLVALMLSSQTKDAVVGTTMRSLQEYGLDVETIHGTSAEDLNALINKVGFHNNKTKYLKQTCDILLAKYNGDIPPTAAEMMELPGVGPKMAYIVESIVYEKTTGIGVDTHMHRMFNVLKWVNSKTPEKTREQLEGWLPRDKWPTVNVLWVGIGQETQQQKEKIIKKAIASSRPADALGLIRKLGVDLVREGKRYGLEDEIQAALLGEKRGGVEQ